MVVVAQRLLRQTECTKAPWHWWRHVVVFVRVDADDAVRRDFVEAVAVGPTHEQWALAQQLHYLSVLSCIHTVVAAALNVAECCHCPLCGTRGEWQMVESGTEFRRQYKPGYYY